MNQENNRSLNAEAPNELDADFSLKRRVFATFGVLFAAFLYRGVYVTAPAFAETFKSFGTPISTITKFFTSYYGLFIYLAVFSLLFSSFWVVGIFNKNIALKVLNVSKYNLYFSILCFILFMVSVYLPIFQLGSAV